MSIKKILIDELGLDESTVNTLLLDENSNQAIMSLMDYYQKKEERYKRTIESLEPYISSPYLKESVRKVEYSGVINREFVVQAEFDKKINEQHGTMYYFKEKAKEFGHLAGLDAFDIRAAFTEGIQNILEHGHGQYVYVHLVANNLDTDDAYLEMSFKHHLESKDFYSLKEADKNADAGFIDQESPRGRGEFMMRELMDERKFINGLEKNADGKSVYFFKRIMRKYRKPKEKKSYTKLTTEFKDYIDSLQDYSTAMFIRMDYFSGVKELVLSENKAHSEKINSIMNTYGYSLNGQDSYRNINFTFWHSDINRKETDSFFKEILIELRDIMEETKN